MSDTSIIIATHNRCKLLPRAVESARRAGKNIEVIVIDDASVDRTREVCEAWTDIVYIRVQRRRGLGGARNLGIIAGKSKYISFLDDDDVRLPGSIDEQVKLLESRPDAGMIYGRALYGDEEGQANGTFYPQHCPREDIFLELLRWNFVPCPSVVFRRTCLSRIGLLDEAAPGLEDWDLWIRIAELYPVLATEQPVAVWRRPSYTSDQFTARPERMHRLARRLHAKKWLRLPRALNLGAGGAREIAHAYSEQAMEQLISEVAARIKDRRMHEAAKIAWAIFGMYPMVGSKKVLSVSLPRLLKRLNGNGVGSGVQSLEKFTVIHNLNRNQDSPNEDSFL
jgi:glycosyltransferase involved in cell wall biosynthesis